MRRGSFAAERALVGIYGSALGRHCGPLLLAVGMIGAVVVGGNGLRPADVARALAPWSMARLVTGAVWIVLSRGPIRNGLAAPGSTWARTSVVSRPVQVMLVGAMVLMAQAPIPMLIAVGGRPWSAIQVALALIAGGLALRPWELGLALVRLAAPAPAIVPLSAVCFAWLSRALGRRPSVGPAGPGSRAGLSERRQPRSPMRWVGALPYPVVLLVAMLRTVFRSGALRLLSSGAMPIGGLLLVNLAPSEERSMRARGLVAAVGALGAAPLLGPVTALLRVLRPQLRVERRSIGVALGAAVLVVAWPSMVFAAGAQTLSRTPETLGVGLCYALAALALERLWGGRRRDATARLVLGGMALVAGLTAVDFVGAIPVAVVTLSAGVWLWRVERTTHGSGAHGR